MPDGREQGVITLIRKTGRTKTINKYRPIALLNSIYKIWGAIMANRLKRIMNILTKETQRGYKIKNQQLISYIAPGGDFVKKKINGEILIDLSNALGRIDRGDCAKYYMGEAYAPPS